MTRFPLSRGLSDNDSARSESCESCYFWNPWFHKADLGTVAKAVDKFLGTNSAAGRGECRRHSPTGSNRWHWTDGNDWCGDYEQGAEHGAEGLTKFEP